MPSLASTGDATHLACRPTNGAEPEGWYRDPIGGTGRRFWDGEAWTHRVEQLDADEQLAPRWKRQPLSFLTHRWFHVLLVGVVIGVGGTFTYTRTHSLAIITATAFVFTCTTTTALGIFVAGHLRLGEVVTRSEIVIIALIGGMVGFWTAGLIEQVVGDVINETYFTGPIEETTKLLVPLALFAVGRYRNPRAGLAIVLASAAGVGILEATTRPIFIDTGFWHGMGPHGLEEIGPWSVGVVRPLIELTHMLLTGFIAAVAWRVWHLRGGFGLTWGVVGAFLAAWAMHSGFDLWGGDSTLLSVGFIVAMYFAFKEAARQLTPPQAIFEVPPGWRPRWLHTAPEAVQTGPASQAA